MQAPLIELLTQAFQTSGHDRRERARQAAYALIGEQYPARPLQAGARLLIWGKPNIKRQDLKEQLSGLGVEALEESEEANPTHILLGLGLREQHFAVIKKHLRAGVQPLTHAQLLEFLQEQEQFYLAPSDAESAEQTSAGIRQLLRSGDRANIDIALQMMQAGGVPKHLLVDVFAVSLGYLPSTQRNDARKLLLQYGSQALFNASRSNTQGRAIYNSQINTQLWGSLLEQGLFSWRDVHDYERYYAKKLQTPRFWLLYMDDVAIGNAYIKDFFEQNPEAMFCLNGFKEPIKK